MRHAACPAERATDRMAGAERDAGGHGCAGEPDAALRTGPGREIVGVSASGRKTLGKQTGSAIDSAMNTAWDVAGLIPEFPSMLSTGIDVAKAGYSEGMGTLYGPALGALVVVAMQNYLAQFGEWVTVTQGAVFVACVLLFRRGIVGEAAKAMGWEL